MEVTLNYWASTQFQFPYMGHKSTLLPLKLCVYAPPQSEVDSHLLDFEEKAVFLPEGQAMDILYIHGQASNGECLPQLVLVILVYID